MVEDDVSIPAVAGEEASRRRRRWPWIVVGVLVVAGAGGWWVWTRAVPTWRPDLEAGETFGVDVSNHQDEIDWEAVAGDDMTFAYMKATEGGDWVDQWFQTNWDGAAAAGLDRGAYHFFTLCRPGADQAAHFLAVAPPTEEALPHAVDLELRGNCDDRPDQDWLDRELDVFLDEVETATGQPVLLYVGNLFEERYGVREALDRPFWHRSIFKRPGIEGWHIWQASAKAEVDGIDGEVDLNVLRNPAD